MKNCSHLKTTYYRRDVSNKVVPFEIFVLTHDASARFVNGLEA